jgi:hypothetical protein
MAIQKQEKIDLGGLFLANGAQKDFYPLSANMCDA